MIKITPELLRAAVGCTQGDAERFAGPLDDACARYGIDTPARLAAFLAQIGHESGSFRYTSEIWGPTPAQVRYEGRSDLGNTQPGDGAAFRGHGLIQITGRANHTRIRDRLRARLGDLEVPDFEAGPDQLVTPRWAALSAADYWDDKRLNALADAGDFEAITRRINGALNGYQDRKDRWARALGAVREAAAPQTITPPPAPATPAPPAPKEPAMPFPAIIAALLPSLISAVPELTKAFRPGDEKADRNAAAAATVFKIAQTAIGASNEQDTIQRIEADPAAAAAVRQAIRTQWFDIVEAGGGGIDGARKQDAIYATGQAQFWKSPSFWALLILGPLVYMIVGSISGLWGYSEWTSDVRAAIATAVISLVLGGAAGYYWGSTTSKNSPAPVQQ